MWTQPYNNKVRFFERYKDSVSGETFVLSCTMPKDTAQNRRKAKDKLDLKAMKRKPKPDSLTFSELVELHNAYQSAHWKPSTAKQDAMHCVKLVSLIGEGFPIDKLTAGYITQVLDSSGNSPTWKNEKLKHLKQLVRWAYRQQYLDNTECIDRLSRWPDKSAREKVSEKYMEKSELKALLDSMEDVGYAMVTKMLVLTGMRIGELIALEISDVDFERNVIKITKTYELNTGMVGTPKTFDSAREIHMRPEVAELAKSAVHRSKQIGLANGHRSKLLFPWHDGSYLHYTAYRAYFGPRAEKVTGRKISIHALRHTFTALMAEADVPLPIVSRQLGHHDSKVTSDIYMHVTEERKKKDANLLDNVRIM